MASGRSPPAGWCRPSPLPTAAPDEGIKAIVSDSASDSRWQQITSYNTSLSVKEVITALITSCHLVLGFPDGRATLVLCGLVRDVLSGEGEVVMASLHAQRDAPRLGFANQRKGVAGGEVDDVAPNLEDYDD